MKVYESGDIRNVALVGHQGAGKTMVAEAMLFASGAINRMGSIGEGSTVSDYHESEHQREMSIFSTLVHCEHEGVKVNVLDTPGFPDFMGEVVSSLRVVDAAVVVLHAQEPVQVGTEVAWGFAEEADVPCVFVVNHMDKDGVEFDGVIDAIQDRFGREATVLQLPGGSGSRALVDLLTMKQLTFPEGKTVYDIKNVDEGLARRAADLRNTLVEMIAENDEDLMERFFEEGDLTEQELLGGLRQAIRRRQIFPILVSSAATGIGISRLMEVLGSICPPPTEGRPMQTVSGEPHPCTPDGDPVAFVFRTMSEQHVGEYSFFKVCSGTVDGSDLESADGSMERLGNLFVLRGRNRDSVAKLHAGDLGAVVKLKHTHSNDTLRGKGSSVAIAPIEYPSPRYKAAIHATTAGEEDKLSSGLHKLVGEDPSLQVIHDADLGQLLLGGQGEMHIDIAKFRLHHRFGVDVELSVPKVSYREAVQGSGRAQYRHKKQTGGAGQFADIAIIVEALEGDYRPPADVKVRHTSTFETAWGAKLELIDAIVSGVIDMRRFSGAIHKGIVEAMKAGPIAGYPCADMRVVVYDGKMHSVDSNEAAFKTAARHAFEDAFEKATPVMLEPVHDLEVMMPDEYTGDVMSDLNSRRARIQGMVVDGHTQKITAHIPEMELLRYATHLRSLTHGRGLHHAAFHAYEPMPHNVQEEVVAEARRAEDGEG